MVIRRILGLIILLTALVIFSAGLYAAYTVDDALTEVGAGIRDNLALASQSLDTARNTLALSRDTFSERLTLPRCKARPSSPRNVSSSPSIQSGTRSRKSSPLPLTLRISQAQLCPAPCPLRAANPVIEIVIALSFVAHSSVYHLSRLSAKLVSHLVC